MKRIFAFHGTDTLSAMNIAFMGVDLSTCGRTDSGDFGEGLYLTTSLSRAKAYGVSIVQMYIDKKQLAYISNPYFLNGTNPLEPETEEEKLFHAIAFDKNTMKTCSGLRKKETAKKISNVFRSLGYKGIYTDYHGDIVIFNKSAILGIERHN